MTISPDSLVPLAIIAGAITSAAVAVFTYQLAKRTKELAEQTKHLAEQTVKSIAVAQHATDVADRHHQEAQSALVVMDSLLLLWLGTDQVGPKRVSRFALGYTIRNIGFGPATDITVLVDFAGYHLTKKHLEPSLGKGDSRKPDGANPDGRKLFEIDNPENAVFTLKPQAIVTIGYKNVFGGSSETKYRLGYHTDPEVVIEEISPPDVIENRLG